MQRMQPSIEKRKHEQYNHKARKIKANTSKPITQHI